jgi:hypothetical protein
VFVASLARPASGTCPPGRCWTWLGNDISPPQPTVVLDFHAVQCAYWIATYEAAFTSPGFEPSL